MTLSIVASNPITKELCVATMTFLVAVGDVVPMVVPGAGSVAVQAKVKPSNRFKILKLMKKGHSAESAIKCALENDELREYRQIIAINHEGNGHVFSGSKTIDISDYFIDKNFVIAGNMLASKKVVSSMATSFENSNEIFFPKRCLLSLFEGNKMGGDKRGRMSAAIIYSTPNKKTMTLRIDHSNNPLSELFEALELRYSNEYEDIFDL